MCFFTNRKPCQSHVSDTGSDFFVPEGNPFKVMEGLETSLQLAPGRQVFTWGSASIAWDLEFTPEVGALLQENSRKAELGQKTKLLILVNGFQRGRSDFRAFRKRLAQLDPFIVTVALDNRGSGETTLDFGIDNNNYAGPVGDTLMNQMAADVILLGNAVGKRLGVGSFSALGISMGGMICQRAFSILATVSASWPSPLIGIEKLILVSTTAGGDLRVWPNGIKNLVYSDWPRDEAGLYRVMARYFGKKFLNKSPMLVEVMVKNMLRAHSLARDKSSFCSKLQFDAAAGFNGERDLAGIGCPVLVISGDEDQIIPLANAENLKAIIGQAAIKIYPETGHLILVEQPEMFVYDVAGFLREA